MSSPDAASSHRTPRAGRRQGRLPGWALALACWVIIPTLCVVLAEVGLRIGGYGETTRFLVERNIEGARYSCVNTAFYQQFLSYPLGSIADLDDIGFRVPEEGEDDAFRIFIFGGSAAHGCTPDYAYGLGRVLEAMLESRFPDLNCEVYNAACPALNSHVMRRAAQACAALEPDVFIIYMGNNEFSGPFGPAWSEKPVSSPARVQAYAALNELRLVQLFKGRNADDLLPRKTTARTYFKGLKRLGPSSPAREAMYAHYEANLRAMYEAGLDAGAHILLCTVGVNLRDWEPFASEHRPDLALSEEDAWEETYDAGVSFAESGDYAQARKAFLAAREGDDQYAAVPFRLGQCDWELGDYDSAREQFGRACALDSLPLRADSRINGMVEALAAESEENRATLVDTATALAGVCRERVADNAVFWDFVHFNFRGNYTVARALFERLAPMLKAGTQSEGKIAAPSEEECARRLGLTEAVVLRHARSLVPAFQFWGVPEKQLDWLTGQIAALEGAVGPDASQKEAEGYRAALAIDPEDYYLRRRYAEALLAMGEPQRALEEADSLVERFPDKGGARLVIARALHALGQDEGAVEALCAVLGACPASVAAEELLAQVLAQVEPGKRESLVKRCEQLGVEVRAEARQ